MEKIGISIVVTVLNEALTVKALLESLGRQKLKPDEIVIVDAGSTDGTVKVIEEYAHVNKQIPIRIIEAPGANRSQGRNIGIEAAKNDYLGLTDGGCEVESDWLDKLWTNLTIHQSQAVAGYYQYHTENPWHECFGPFLAVLPENFNRDTFLPSSRSLLISKAAWIKADKYPNHLNTCEDLVFAKNLKSKVKMSVEPKALVTWKLPSSLSEFTGVVANYAQGDVEAVYLPHLLHNMVVGLRSLMVLFIPPLWFVYFLFPIMKFKNRLSQANWWRWPIVQLWADVGVIWGSLRGIWLKVS